ncbi:MAG: hypothetical protein O2820_23345 [Planctomycetota bacterium]|nr:hypothetical protein [Planctomycetota bacterium]
MQPVIQEFVIWFGRFVFCSTVILIAGHFVGRRMRARKAEQIAESEASVASKSPTGGMKKLASRS